jgi:iron-sulfur cluster assembly protein
MLISPDRAEGYIVLTLTENAVTAIRGLTDSPQVPDSAGLRIATDDAGGELTLSLVPGPQEGDRVVDAAGAVLFLDPQAAQVLDDKALDAAVDDDGSVRFAVSPQAA